MIMILHFKSMNIFASKIQMMGKITIYQIKTILLLTKQLQHIKTYAVAFFIVHKVRPHLAQKIQYRPILQGINRVDVCSTKDIQLKCNKIKWHCLRDHWQQPSFWLLVVLQVEGWVVIAGCSLHCDCPGCGEPLAKLSNPCDCYMRSKNE